MGIGNYWIFIFLLFFTQTYSFGQRETVAVRTISWQDDFTESYSSEIQKSVNSFFNKLMNDLGYKVVERESVEALKADYMDQRREDYLDGKTVRIQLLGAKEILFIDIVEGQNEIQVYYSLVDVYNENVYFFEKFNLNRSLGISNELNRISNSVIQTINNYRSLNFYFYGFDMKKSVKLITGAQVEIAPNTEIYGFNKESGIIQVTLKAGKQLSSNMLETEILNYNKKNLGKITDFDFSTLLYSNQKTTINFDFSKRTLSLLPGICVNVNEYLNLVHECIRNMSLNDGLHKDHLDFERLLQSNELFMVGKSYYKEKQLSEQYYEANFSKDDSRCSLNILLNQKPINSIQYHSVINLANTINQEIKK